MQRQTLTKHTALIALSCVVVTTGCSLSLSPLSKRSAAFGNTASIVVRDTSMAYQTVQDTTYQAQVSSLVLNFDREGFVRKRIKPFLPSQDLEIRLTLLQGLQEYADQLASTSSEKAFAPLDQQTAELAQGLRTLSSNDALQKLAPAASDTEIKGFATAVDLLGRVLIERKRRKELPHIIREMQPALEQLSALLIHDLGTPPQDGQPGSGLRDALWRKYDDLISNQEDFISNGGKQFTPSERAVEIAKLPQLVAQQRAADDALARTQTTLRDLVATHRALLDPGQAGTFKTRLGELVEDGQQIASFYSTVKSR